MYTPTPHTHTQGLFLLSESILDTESVLPILKVNIIMILIKQIRVKIYCDLDENHHLLGGKYIIVIGAYFQ